VSRAADLLLASPAHAGVLAALHALAFPPAARWDAAAMAAQLGLPGVFGLLHLDGGMVLARVAADEAEILTLGVAPATRRRGVGRGLLLAAGRHAASLGARAMLLEVADRNAAARALYAGTGYREVGRRARYYDDGSDALVMCCLLTPAAAADG
jgi:ribosomal-protein-alanine N-acetyltransferase